MAEVQGSIADNESRLSGQALNLCHGGDLYTASQQFGTPVADWIDLSTGINPQYYPLPAFDSQAYQALPYLRPELDEAVRRYYADRPYQLASGSQPIIQFLPEVLDDMPVLLPDFGYQEHRQHWQAYGAELRYYPALDDVSARLAIEQALEQAELKGERFHLLVINPNNPTGLTFTPQQLADWADRLAPGAQLIVDEAFVDLSPEQSVLGECFRPNMLVLRSFGKFFGLAGIRLGAIFGSEAVMQGVAKLLGPWPVNGPAQTVAIAALNDVQWQQQARENIAANAELTEALLQPVLEAYDAQPFCREQLFSCHRLATSAAYELYQRLAEQGILVRLIDLHDGTMLLRTGIINALDPNTASQLKQRLEII
nr:aminotransferase class I/II-fold pyridoxal phosphate-dependent enzyme [Aliamphritea spongicola]